MDIDSLPNTEHEFGNNDIVLCNIKDNVNNENNTESMNVSNNDLEHDSSTSNPDNEVQISSDSKPPCNNLSANIYRPPNWAMNCVSSKEYKLEVIKNGVQLPECTVNLCSIDSFSTSDSSLSFCLIGRQPQLNCINSDNLFGKCIILAHPSVSRLHAVLQYGRPPQSVNIASGREPDPIGWYLQDLDSTHGTFVNKRRLPPGRFVRIRVGYVLRFGCSTRLHLLCGPDEDSEQESNKSWTEIKKDYQERQKSSKQENAISSVNSCSTQSVDLGCDWGISIEESVPDAVSTPGFLQTAACLSHEKLYHDDPKRALNAYFEREGIDPAPQYEFLEAPFGKQHCRIELPLSSGTVTAEAIVSGKRKEATVACALEACQILDRLGEFDPNKDHLSASKHIRSRAYWEENDYYSSDEDTFIDRTGVVEKKRLERMRQLGVDGAKNEEAEKLASSAQNRTDSTAFSENVCNRNSTMLALLSELEKVGEQIIALEEQIDVIDKKFKSTQSNASELDELEAYMNALKTGSIDHVKRSKLKAELFKLRQIEMQLFHRAGLPHIKHKTKSNSNLINQSILIPTDAATAVRAAKHKLECTDQSSENQLNNLCENKIKNVRANMDAVKRSLSSHNMARVVPRLPKVDDDEPFEAEEDDDSGDDKVDNVDPVSVQQNTSKSNIIHKRSIISKSDEKVSQSNEIKKDFHESSQVDLSPKDSYHVNNPETITPISSDSVEEEQLSSQSTIKQNLPLKCEKPKNSSIVNDPDYVEWVPPSDQHGDGITALNAKYGY